MNEEGVAVLEEREATLEDRLDYRKQKKIAFSWLPGRIWSRLKYGKEAIKQVDSENALKRTIGKRRWKHFYRELIKGAAKDAGNRGLITAGELKAINDDIESSGRFFRDKYQIEVQEVEEYHDCKTCHLEDGAIYKITIPRLNQELFVKKMPLDQDYERLKEKVAMVSSATEEVHPIIAADNSNQITAERYIPGSTELYYIVKLSSKRPESFEPNEAKRTGLLRKALNQMRELSAKITPELKEKLPTIESFTEDFYQRFIKTLAPRARKTDPLVQKALSLYQRQVAGTLDSQPKIACHSDFHSANTLITEDGKIWFTDWEFVSMHAPQVEPSKLLRKIGSSKRIKEKILRNDFYKLKRLGLYEGTLEEYLKAFDAMEIHLGLESAAKYLYRSEYSEKHKDKLVDMGNIYYTETLDTFRGTDLEEAIKALVKKRAKRELVDLKETGQYDEVKSRCDPLKHLSMYNLGKTSLMSGVFTPMWRKAKKKAKKVAKYAIAAGLVGALAWGGITAFLNYRQEKLLGERAEEAYSKVEHVPMEFSEETEKAITEALKDFKNVTDSGIRAYINADGDWRRTYAPETTMHPEWYRRVTLIRGKKTFLKDKYLKNPADNIYALAFEISKMKEKYTDLSDVFFAVWGDPDTVDKWKKKGFRGNWHSYSHHPDFNEDYDFAGRFVNRAVGLKRMYDARKK